MLQNCKFNLFSVRYVCEWMIIVMEHGGLPGALRPIKYDLSNKTVFILYVRTCTCIYITHPSASGSLGDVVERTIFKQV